MVEVNINTLSLTLCAALRRSVAKCEYYCHVYIFLEKVNKQSAGEQCEEQQLRGEVRTIQISHQQLQHCIFSDINILLNMSLQIIITPYYPNTFASVHNFFPDTQFFVYPIHQTFNNKIFESYSNLYSELFRLENTEFHFNCLFILTIICWKYVLDNICNKAVKYRRGKDILQGQEQ